MAENKNCFKCGGEGAPHLLNGLNFCTDCFVKQNNDLEGIKQEKRKEAMKNVKPYFTLRKEKNLAISKYRVVFDNGKEIKEKIIDGNKEQVIDIVKNNIIGKTKGWTEDSINQTKHRFIRLKVPTDEEIKKFCAGYNETIYIEGIE